MKRDTVQMEERKFLSSDLATEYRAYQSDTGRFLPQLWRGNRQHAADL